MQTLGFFTDTTLCIGCKACEVACKQWNQLPADGFELTGMSYDNTAALGASTWRHVTFAERPLLEPDGGSQIAWKMMSDVCKHCERAGCLEACPTGAIMRTEHGSVYIQPDVCNGCGYCIPACPFGVVARRDDDGRAWKCTLCYDRLQGQLEPACAKACPTDSIAFGPLDELRARADARVATLRERGVDAHLYGESAQAQPGTEGLHAFFLLADKPEVYNLPPAPSVPTKGVGRSWLGALAGAAGLLALAVGSVLLSREANT
ncbi:MAG: 4Fe-4S dicluster domain-containing protein [Kofleriaceae bacterium]|nr:4Fe-4S dicluster domain-containing protein [Kofleriaceae bacterium]